MHLDRPAEDALGVLVEYKGTYSQYRAARASDEERTARKAALQAKEIARLQTVVDRFGAKATKAAMAHSKEKQIVRLEAQRVHVGKGDRTLRVRVSRILRQAEPRSSPPKVCRRRTAAHRCSRTCRSTSAVATVCWYSVSTVPGRRASCASSPARPRPTWASSRSATTSASATTRRSTTTCRPMRRCSTTSAPPCPTNIVLTETQLRGLLGMMGLSGEKVYQESGTLSGGEKTKLALAMLMVGRNNLLLLDEPTNNLDPASRQSVTDSLSGWKGTIVFVSHDTEFVEQLRPTKVLLMPDGELDYFSNDWLELVSLA